MTTSLKIFAGRSHPAFAKAVCGHLGVELGDVTFTKFANENLEVKIEENTRESDVFCIQTATPQNLHESIMELLIMIDTLRYASASRITAVLPYYMYVRSDKKDRPRISITARLLADLLTAAGANRILTMNLHSPQIMGFARIPVDQLDAIPIICDYLAQKPLRNVVAVAPDVGRTKVTEAFARRLNLPVVVLDKRREGANVVIKHIIGDVQGKDVILFDDEVLTGKSLLAGIDALKKRGAKRFMAACVHGVLAADAIDRLEASSVEELVTTDSLPQMRTSPKITVLSVAQLFAEAIKAIHTGGSVSRLFRDERSADRS